MINPIIKNRNIILAYVVIWAIIIPIQSLVINFFYGVDGNISIYDSAIFNLLYAVLGFNLWYIIRFNLKERKNIFDLLLNHFIYMVKLLKKPNIYKGKGIFFKGEILLLKENRLHAVKQ